MSSYRPETDTLPELKAEGVKQYQEMVELLRWSVDLGRVDIILEITLMSTYLALSRRGYLKQVFQMFGYLKANPKINICFDPQHPTIDERSFTAHGWYDF